MKEQVGPISDLVKLIDHDEFGFLDSERQLGDTGYVSVTVWKNPTTFPRISIQVRTVQGCSIKWCPVLLSGLLYRMWYTIRRTIYK